MLLRQQGNTVVARVYIFKAWYVVSLSIHMFGYIAMQHKQMHACACIVTVSLWLHVKMLFFVCSWTVMWAAPWRMPCHFAIRLSCSRNVLQGCFVGVSVEGRLLTVRRGINERFYGMQVHTQQHAIAEQNIQCCKLLCVVHYWALGATRYLITMLSKYAWVATLGTQYLSITTSGL
jgi:hypothetical protein